LEEASRLACCRDNMCGQSCSLQQHSNTCKQVLATLHVGRQHPLPLSDGHLTTALLLLLLLQGLAGWALVALGEGQVQPVPGEAAGRG
jgi:hypothetical protein